MSKPKIKFYPTPEEKQIVHYTIEVQEGEGRGDYSKMIQLKSFDATEKNKAIAWDKDLEIIGVNRTRVYLVGHPKNPVLDVTVRKLVDQE